MKPYQLPALIGCIVAMCLPPIDAFAGDRLTVAVVDAHRASVESNPGKRARAAIQALLDKRRNEIAPLEVELKRLREEFESKRWVLKEEVLAERKFELLQRESQLKRRIEGAMEDVEFERRKLMQPILRRVENAVKAIAKQKGYAMVVERSGSGVVFFEEYIDITRLVIDRLNSGQ